MNFFLCWFIKKGASLPVGWKGPLLEKIFRRILLFYKKNNGKEEMVHSNLGISNDLKVELYMFKSPDHFLFGVPKTYKGEYHTLQVAAWLCKYSSAFVDIGANWGYYTYYIAKKANKKIYWFEPNPFLYKNLQQNIHNNKLQNISGSDLAISDTTGNLTFFINQQSDDVSSIIEPDEKLNIISQKVNCIRFEDWVIEKLTNKLLVKVDIENAEWNFIKGALNALKSIEYLIMEVLGPARQSGFINYMIEDLSFKAYYINMDKIEFVKKEDMRYTIKEYNWLFCKEGPAILTEKFKGSIFSVVI